jgi:hypothetical protein
MKSKIILYLVIAFCGVLIGCSSMAHPDSYKEVITAINGEDWDALRKLAKPGTHANDAIKLWESCQRTGHSVCVGKLVQKEEKEKYDLDGKPYTMYSFELSYKDGMPNPHWLQILVREKGTQSQILDFWNFGW